MADVAQREVLDRAAIFEVDAHARGLVRDQHEVAERAERAFRDDVEAGDLHIGGGPADATLPALVELNGREGLAADLAGNVRATGDHHLLMHHCRPRS